MGSTSDADWAECYRRLSGRGPRPLAVAAADLASPPGVALDLGCGDGTETALLLARGWNVVAVDLEATAVDMTILRNGEHPRLSVQRSDLMEYEPPPADFILASATLPFVPPDSFEQVWRRLCGALQPKGLLAVHFFGVRDSWASGLDTVEGMTFHDRTTVEELLDGLEVLQMEEREYDGPSGRGPKHWHRFDIIARQR